VSGQFILTDCSHRRSLKKNCPIGYRAAAQRIVELISHNHRQDWGIALPSKFSLIIARERHGIDLVFYGNRHPGNSGQGRADQAAAARFVPRMLGPF
jgi:hypothetical protein